MVEGKKKIGAVIFAFLFAGICGIVLQIIRLARPLVSRYWQRSWSLRPANQRIHSILKELGLFRTSDLSLRLLNNDINDLRR